MRTGMMARVNTDPVHNPLQARIIPEIKEKMMRKSG
jgi:hypothetical protein